MSDSRYTPTAVDITEGRSTKEEVMDHTLVKLRHLLQCCGPVLHSTLIASFDRMGTMNASSRHEEMLFCLTMCVDHLVESRGEITALTTLVSQLRSHITRLETEITVQNTLITTLNTKITAIDKLNSNMQMELVFYNHFGDYAASFWGKLLKFLRQNTQFKNISGVELGEYFEDTKEISETELADLERHCIVFCASHNVDFHFVMDLRNKRNRRSHSLHRKATIETITAMVNEDIKYLCEDNCALPLGFESEKEQLKMLAKMYVADQQIRLGR